MKPRASISRGMMPTFCTGRRFLLALSARTLLAGLSGCGAALPVEDTIDDLRTHAPAVAAALQLGRRVASGVSEPSAVGLALADAVVSADNDAASGSPSWVQFDATLMPEISRSDLVDYSEHYLADQFGAWLTVGRDVVAVGELKSLSPSLAVLNFARLHEGLPVRDSHISLYFSELANGHFKLREITARHAGSIVLPRDIAPAPSLEQLRAILGETDWQPVEQSPLIFARMQDEKDLRYVRATEVTYHREDTDEVLTVTIDDASLDVLEAFSNRTTASLTAKALPRSYSDAAVAMPLPFARVQSGSLTQTTDGLGEVAEALQGNLTISLSSARTRIAGSGQNAMTIAAVGSGDSTLLDLRDFDQRGVNAYLSIERAAAFVLRHLKASEASLLTAPTSVRLDVQGSCNAFYTNRSISLYRAGSGCANMALVNDVIYHEWGHALDDTVGKRRGITDGAYSEGIGDILSAYMVQDSSVGVGFFTTDPTRPIRALVSSRRFPTDRGAEVHVEGQIIGGAFWQLHKAMVERYGPIKGAFDAEALFLRHLLNTDTYTDSYQAVLRLDDDDGNAATRSPNYCLITKAFAAHGLATLPANCTDAPEKMPAKADSSITAGIASRSEQGVVLMASGQGAQSMQVCLGTAKDCPSLTSGTWQAMSLDGTIGDRRAFVLANPVRLEAGSFFTLATLDDKGNLIGKRTIKMIGR